ncbi:histidine--tRNA ligase [Halobacteriovorax vibrionivorans]|uniref:Histidine--tRNA ligase n=1 Tax=Halobacteriovorax vibrionivorans TaxID=2152716 RepID=A0ABY0IDU9_9BACT|nr:MULTISPECIES: histidine--tRNA ligase [Halobacteriovorax]RZF21141.1 histidine--tRNA ligase [Halobacteriovorax vibrionivorans]TGD46262.1 histidine--tRNA ligase [Halobacteriovorax sp. Y22]
MATIRPQNAKGTRDFGPLESSRRNYIFDTIKKRFQSHGFMPLETPAVENLNVLTGKYGEEGDKLLFRVLNSGDFLKKVKPEDLEEKNLGAISAKMCDRGLRYDLTIPFARYVCANLNELALPFKRYQIQPVWRADRPQKGRYREFYQCDGDIIGTESLLSEVSLVEVYHDVFNDLKLDGVEIVINNRKILQGIASVLGVSDKLTDMTIAIDKLDKIGAEKVGEELLKRDFSEEQVARLSTLLTLEGSSDEKLSTIKEFLGEDEVGKLGLEELEFVLSNVRELGIENLVFDPTLARGLDYYTGCIFEVKLVDGSMGSIGGGGRYDDLTSMFGQKEKLSGVGISFGAERIYDVMLDRGLFEDISASVDFMIINMSDDDQKEYLQIARNFRAQGRSIEIYPTSAKMKKQMTYANKRGVKNVIFYGDQEKEQRILKIKDMETGQEKQESLA